MWIARLVSALLGCAEGTSDKDSATDDTGDSGTSPLDSGDSADTADTGDTADDTADSADSADTDVPVPPDPPCADAGWGAITDPANAVQVREDGDDATADGSGNAPFRTLAAALDAWRAGTGSSIALGPGTFAGIASLAGDHGDGTSDNDLRIEGCSANETILVPADDEIGLAILKFTEVTGASLAGVTLRGGYRALWIAADSTLSVTGVTVASAERAGIVAVGAGTRVTLLDVEVVDPVSAPDYAGDEAAYGISVSLADVSMEGGGIRGATGVAFLADAATVDLRDVTITDTAPLTTGEFGRGVQLQAFSVATLDTVTLDANQDAALFSSQSLSLQLSALTVSDTVAGVLVDDADGTGDGVVVSQGAPEEAIYDASLFTTSITGCTVTGSARAGIVVQDVLLQELSGNTAGVDNTYAPDGVSIIVQGNTQVSATSPDTYVEGVDALDLNWTALQAERGE